MTLARLNLSLDLLTRVGLLKRSGDHIILEVPTDGINANTDDDDDILPVPEMPVHHIDIAYMPRSADDLIEVLSKVQVRGLHTECQRLVHEAYDMFDTQLPPEGADLPPMDIRVPPGTVPVRLPPRRCHDNIREACDEIIATWFTTGRIVKATLGAWAMPALVVPNDGIPRSVWRTRRMTKSELRLVTDMQAVNAVTLPYEGPMINMRDILTSALDTSTMARLI